MLRAIQGLIAMLHSHKHIGNLVYSNNYSGAFLTQRFARNFLVTSLGMLHKLVLTGYPLWALRAAIAVNRPIDCLAEALQFDPTVFANGFSKFYMCALNN